MTVWNQIISNQVLVSAALAWLVAQVLKTLINFISTKSFSVERLWGSGGMPSSHSATVTGLAASIAITEGVSSPLFAVATMFAFVVMYDAINVRQEAGKHAKWINLIATSLAPDIPLETKFKEYLGHTPLQVIMGALLGIAVAMGICL
ncbi:MAG: divergent PAP2 family protein [Lachnospiraceae bacterium]|nr:divergent PAP2 family protein [Lachnospiraceae bacterium]